MAKTIDNLSEEIIHLKIQLEESEKLRSIYENGGAKLYYAQQRKMSEMANVMNKYNLENVDMASKSDATFDRVFKLIEKSESISSTSKGLGEASGVTGDEKKDISKKPFVETIADTRH